MRQFCNIAYVAQAESLLADEDPTAFAKWEAELNAVPRDRLRPAAGRARPESRVDPGLLNLMSTGA